MLAPFATLIFLVVLWLTAKFVFETVGENDGRIVDALFGRTHRVETRIPAMRVRISPQRAARPSRAAQPQWRAAA